MDSLTVRVLLTGIGYYAGAWYGVTQTITAEGIAVLWPPNAVLLAALLLSPYRQWPWIGLAALAAECIADLPIFPLWTAISFGLTNLFESALAAWLIRHFTSEPFDFNRLANGIRFLVFGPLLTSAFAALFGAAVYVLLQGAEAGYFALWRIWWFGDALGLLILTPPIVTLWRQFERHAPFPFPFSWRKLAEAAGLALSVILLGTVVLIQDEPRTPQFYFAPVVLLPLGMWAAIRFGVFGTAATIMLIALVAVALLVRGVYPYPGVTAQQAVWLTQEYLAIVAVVTVGLSILRHEMEEQRQALITSERELRQFNDQLEQRVAERTAEIEQRAAQLRALTFELSESEERERRRLAQVLHDHLQQLLVAGKFEVASALTSSENNATTTSLKRVGELLDQSIHESRSLTVELSPPVLYDAGLTAGLGWLAQWMREQHGLTVDLQAGKDVDPSGVDLCAFVFQAVRELLFNVVKHAGVDRATVTVRRDRRGYLEVRVSDCGRGYRATSDHPAKSHDQFGLFSIRERAERLGGALMSRSAPGEGTCAVLTVPDAPETVAHGVATTTSPPLRAAGAAYDPGRPGAIRVIVADDHEVVREGLVAALRDQSDIEIVGEAGDGRAALELVRYTRPAIAVLDVTMPRMNGIEATRAIMAEFPDMRVIGLSVHDSEDIATAMRDAGATAYLNKATASNQLLALIRETAGAIPGRSANPAS